MDYLSTLLSAIASLVTAALLTLQTITGGLFADKIIATTPPPATEVYSTTPPAATSSSQKIIGNTTPGTFAAPAPQKPAAVSDAISLASTTQTPAPPSPAIESEALNTQTREALVNILCTTRSDGGVRPISGSGVFIDARGIVLTNAHIGQYFLLTDYPSKDNVECAVRLGSPAQPRYRAKLLYLPPTWVAKNASQLTAEQGRGTGEHDYALLLVTGSTGPAPLPATFPRIGMTIAEPDLSQSTLLAAYPAGFLDGSNIQKNLFITSAYAAVKELFTFGSGRDVDLVSIGGTVVSQGGSSGGAVVRASDGLLQGIIVTSTAADSTAQRDLRAITLAHINRSLIAHGQGGIEAFLSQDASAAATHFASSTAPGEKELLIKALEHR